MDAATEELLAEQAAQSVVVTILLRAVLKIAGAEQETHERRLLLSKWEENGHNLLAKTPLAGLSPEQQARVIEKAQARLTDIMITAHN